MKYPIFATSNVIDITKPPYNADNTGKVDCTAALRQAIDDCMRGYIDSMNELREELLAVEEARAYGAKDYTLDELSEYLDEVIGKDV